MQKIKSLTGLGEMVEVVTLYSSLGRSGIQVYNMRKTASGKYLMRISPAVKGGRIAAAGRGAVLFQKADRGFLVEAAVDAAVDTTVEDDGVNYGYSDGYDYRYSNGVNYGYDEEVADMGLALTSNYSGYTAGSVSREMVSGDEYGSGYTLIASNRDIRGRNRMDRMMKELLQRNGANVAEAEFVGDGGYGTSWVAVAFASN